MRRNRMRLSEEDLLVKDICAALAKANIELDWSDESAAEAKLLSWLDKNRCIPASDPLALNDE